MRVRKASKNVVDVVVVNKDSHIIRSTVTNPNNAQVVPQYMSHITQVIDRCKLAFKENDELTFLKMRTKKWEFLVVPDKEYMLVAILNPLDESVA